MCNWDNVHSPNFDGCNGCHGCSMSALPALRAFPCDICGEQIETLRLIKWRENGYIIRYWVCLDCWKKIYPAEEPPQAGRCTGGSLAAISAIAASGDGTFGMAAITAIVIVVALVEYRH